MPNTKRLLSVLPYWASVLLLAYMPFHIFLAQYLSLATGGLSVWKVAKDVFIAAVTVFVICLVAKQGKLTKTFEWLLGLTTLYALIHAILWLVHPDLYRQSAILGVTYNLRVPCFAIIGYGAILLAPQSVKTNFIMKVVLTVSTIVAVLGIIQYFLPSDILTHFGYSVARGVKPNFFIDDNPAFPRIMSTLRDPNSLGAYLILPLTALTMFALRLKQRKLQVAVAVDVFVHLAAIWLTYSRSALAAALLAMAIVIWWQYFDWFKKTLQRYWPIVLVLICLAGFGLFTQRHNAQLNGVVTHTTSKQVGQYDSNQYHWLFVKRGLQGIAHDPIGHGPGTAGLASIQNPHGGLLTENYYVQIGYEVGILGLLVFIAINVLVLQKAWINRNAAENILPRVLLASAAAYVVMNMLLHTWSNEAVACQWWILAGISLASGTAAVRSRKKTTK